MKRLVLFAVTLLSVALAGAEIVVRDPDGSEVRLPEKPQRVVIGYLSLAPLWELAGGRAAGVIDTKDRSSLPASMRDLPKVGAGMAPDTEKIAALNPDLVILSAKIERHRAAARQLREIGIATALVDYRNYQDYLAVVELFARLNGKTSESIPAAREAARQIDAILGKTAGLTGPRVAVIFVAASGFQLESANSNTGNMVEL
ncbi:MAG: ABC transporter substrate-binding protein, partial [Victivallaceae bacterium]